MLADKLSLTVKQLFLKKCFTHISFRNKHMQVLRLFPVLLFDDLWSKKFQKPQ